MTRQRVVIVEDSAVTRQLLVAMIDAAEDFEVVDTVQDGLRAVERVAALRPDVVTMDLHLPRIDGLEATRRIMRIAPTPILIVSASANVNDRMIYDALKAGAVGAIRRPLPPGHPDYARRRRRLLDELRKVATVDLGRPSAPLPAPRARLAARPAAAPIHTRTAPVEIIAIAASTGGPAALQRMLVDLPAYGVPPIAVVQHISDGFLDGLADWLAAATSRDVGVARHGERLQAGTVRLAPENRHLSIGPDRVVALTASAPLDGHRPSGTVLFDSVAASCGPSAVGVMLTGMGRDGAAGLLRLRQAGGVTLAQDEASSVVYGMPAAAAALGAVDAIVPLAEMGRLIGQLLGDRGTRHSTTGPSQ